MKNTNKAPHGTTKFDLVNKVRKTLECKDCGALVTNLSFDTRAVSCWVCVAKTVAPPQYKPIIKSDRDEEQKEYPRGWWKKKEYISESGRRYEYGKEVLTEGENDTIDDSGTDSQSPDST